MQQNGEVLGTSVASPSYAGLLDRLGERIADLVDEVVRDVSRPGDDPAAVARAVRPAVTWTLETLAESQPIAASRLDELRDEGRRAAADGEPLQAVLDRYLSTGWVVWGGATRETVESSRRDDRAAAADREALADLGTALLKAGDAAAAAIASAYGEAERAIALRAAGARRDLVDGLLDLAPGDAQGAVRLRRRAADFGLDPASTYRLVVANLGRELPDGDPALDMLNELLARTERPLPRRGVGAADVAAHPIVAGRRGRLVVLSPGPDVAPGFEAALDRVAAGDWLAVSAPPVLGITRLAEADATAVGALVVAGRLGRHGLVASDEVLLERALLADEALLAGAVDRELGPILGARRNGRALLATVEAYLENGENLRATARALGVAPRTVAYRLARVAALIGEPLRGERLLRLSAALLAARLLGTEPAPPTTPVDRSRTASRGRSRARRSRATAM